MSPFLAGMMLADDFRHLSRRLERRDQASFTCKCYHVDQWTMFWLGLESSSNVAEHSRVLVFLRGYVAGREPTDAARQLRDEYAQRQELKVDELDGCFTAGLLDGVKGGLSVYRSLLANGHTYYTSGSHHVLVSSNLALLIRALPTPPRPDVSVLPSFFLFRAVPGRRSLFQGIYRLLPGELLVAERGRVRVAQKRTVADYLAHESSGPATPDIVEQTLCTVISETVSRHRSVANLFSGGVDSSLLQAVANRLVQGRIAAHTIDADHEYSRPNTVYAQQAAALLGVKPHLFLVEEPYACLLQDTIAASAEPPNHVQTAYFKRFAAHLARQRYAAAVCGQAADSLFGIPLTSRLQCARIVRSVLRSDKVLAVVRHLLSLTCRENVIDVLWIAQNWERLRWRLHPVNRVAVFTDWAAVEACFGRSAIDDALLERQALVDVHEIGTSKVRRMHGSALFGEALDTASLWTTLFDAEGVELICPFLDSRILRAVVNMPEHLLYPFRRPKALLKSMLQKYVPRYRVDQPKLGFAQPIFEWLGEGGQLRDWVENIDHYDFVDRRVLARCKTKPTWFLFSLLCYDLWHKTFIRSSALGIQEAYRTCLC